MEVPAESSRAAQRVVCVIGMHRSGTSLVARLANLIGADFGPGEDIARPAPDNPRGFWEHPGLQAVNEAALAAVGAQWDDPGPLTPGWHLDPGLDEVREQARAAMASFNHSPVWGWKDPRTSLILPLWQPLLPATHYIICVRNVSDVAGSLANRNGFDVEKSARLWLTYVAASLEHTDGHPRLLMRYDDLIANGADELRRLIDFLGPTGLRPSAEVEQQCLDEIDQTLRHHRTTPELVAGDVRMPFATRAVSCLLDLGAVAGPDGQHEAAVHAVTVAAVAALADMDRATVEIARVSDSLDITTRDLADARDQLDNQSAVMSDDQGRVFALTREVSTLRDDGTRRQQLTDALTLEHDAIVHHVTASLNAEQARTRQGLRDLADARLDLEAQQAVSREQRERIDALTGELEELRHVRERLEHHSSAVTEQLDRILHSRGWRWLMRYRRLKDRSTRLLRPIRQPGAAVSGAITEPTEAVHAVPVPTGSWAALPLLPAVDTSLGEDALAGGQASIGRRRYDVICFSIIDWEFRFQRPQQMMSQFAVHGHRVFYVSTSRFQPVGAPPAVRQLAAGVYEVQLAAPRVPDVYGTVIGGPFTDALLESLADLRRLYDIAGALSYVMIASWKEIALAARDRWHWPVAYDCMDEWENFTGITPAVVGAELALVRACDLLVVSAARLRDKWTPEHRPMVLARNAVDVEFYATRCRPNDRLAATPRPIVGYFGAIADWFDIDLMVSVARARPQYHFVLLGGVFDVDVRALKALPNVSMLGQQPYVTMPEYLHNFDVCLIPFKVNPITQATDPVKLYEYLSAGKPVVSVDLPELEPCRSLIYVAGDADEFAAQVDRAVVEHDPEIVMRRRTFAAENTWARRYETVREGLAGATAPASVVIVTHDNLILTKLCLESILRNTDHPHVEIFVVDNASTDDTPEFLQAMAARHPEIRVVLNPQNVGFARANNQALHQSGGKHLVLLNNDTIVPPGWLPRLLAHLQDPGIGLVGPVTNFVGNEAKVEVSYHTVGGMEAFAADRARRYEGQRADIPMLAMFCTAMRRDTYERIGPLDERFGIGMFEDDDYTRRVKAAGLRVVCARDVFVHHVGQAAFRKLIERGEYDALFDQNRRSYEGKWGAWTPHRHGQLQWEARPQP